jgi:hypothetical protein
MGYLVFQGSPLRDSFVTAAEFPAAKIKIIGQMSSSEVDGAAVIDFRPWPSGLSRCELLVGEICDIPLNGQYISRMMKIAAEATTAQASRTQPIEQKKPTS